MNELPYSAEELAQAFAQVREAVQLKFAGLQDPDFGAQPGPQDWSPAQHLDHLCRSVGPVAKALGMPKAGLRGMFGRPEAGSRQFDVMEAVYQSELSGGAVAAGRYLPDDPQDLSREGLFKNWNKASERFSKNLKKWDNDELDSHQLPHPLLGNLTMREMVMFSIYHCKHHLADVDQIT